MDSSLNWHAGPSGTLDFFHVLLNGHPLTERKRLSLWFRQMAPDEAHPGFNTPTAKQSKFFVDAESASKAVAALCGDGWEGYAAVALSNHDGIGQGRGGAANAVAMLGIVAELDFDQPATHKPAKPGPLGLTEALGCVGVIPLSPTLIVQTGGGLGLWWLFDRPHILTDVSDRQRWGVLSDGWQRCWRAGAAEFSVRAGRQPWVPDSIGDAARIMRLPGWPNRKRAEERQTAFAVAGDRYSIERLEQAASEWSNRLGPMAPPAKSRSSYKIRNMGPLGGGLDVAAWLTRVGAEVLGEDDKDGAHIWFIRCPNEHNHTPPNGDHDLAIFKAPGRKAGCKCVHETCLFAAHRHDKWMNLCRAIGPPTREEYGDEHDAEWAAIAADLMRGDVMVNPQNCAFTATQQQAANTPATTLVDVDNSPAATAMQAADESSESPPPASNHLPDALLFPPGFLGAFVKHTLDTARIPQPELALGAGIATLATLIGHKLTDPSGTRSNIYILGLAPSGSGKDAPRQVAKAVLLAVNANLLGPDSIASSSAILTSLKASGSQLFPLDEAGDLFAFTKGAGASQSPMVKLNKTLKQLFTESHTLYREAYADTKNSHEIDQPNLSIFGTSTPEKFWGDGVATGDIESGLVGRFMVFEGRVPQSRVAFPERQELPAELVDVAKRWNSFLKDDTDSLLSPNPRPAPYSDEAKERLGKFFGWNFEQSKHPSKRNATAITVWQRADEKVSKLALIHAASRAESPESVKVDAVDVEWAIGIVTWAVGVLLDGAERFMADGQYEKHRKRVLRAIEDAGPSGLTGAEIYKRCRWLEPKLREVVLKDLGASGEVVIQENKPSGAGRPGKKIVAARYRI